MRRSRWSKLRRSYVDLVKERYEIVFEKALESARCGDYEYSRTLAKYMLEIAKETRVTIPRYIKRSICKNCCIPLIPGLTATVRIRSQSRRFSYRVVKCKVCGFIHRYPFKLGGRGNGFEKS